ncbi:MAG: 16S rRNA (adenine(1518)-N(6)/adenine(1519)-N(6))-dimethyltransferase RsmA [Bacteroidales bacterium]|nr:16S rRNA (adenine(1518)-N(6)/adenine(1519)-N(6))-dimethyltransferase RsmA [Bacteroidales bacterium]
MVRPKKHLGQHFLTDPGIAKRITDSLLPGGSSNLIEVGPGKGVLTEFLLSEKDFNLLPVEIDQESVDYLIDHYPGIESKLIRGDFLQLDLNELFGGESFRIIGNFPYNISSQIFFKVLDYTDQITEVVCMVQKEVAQRISSPPGNKTYGILSVLLQSWYDIEYLFTVGPGSFFPPPEVQSGVIRLTRNKRKDLGVDPAKFKQVVKLAFNQRRKMLRNSVKGMLNVDVMENVLFQRRPEQLSVEDFILLTRFIEESHGK